MKLCKLMTVVVLCSLVILLVGCRSSPSDIPDTTTSAPSTKETTYTIGGVFSLTGDGAVYGLPMQRAAQKAIDDLNREWASLGKKQKLEMVVEDGKCNPKDGLTAAQTLVNLKGLNLIYGGTCSGETLGFAPFAEENQVLVLSYSASSPLLTTAGDYIFRDYPSDTAQVGVLAQHVINAGHETIALLSENTDFAQALRQGYKDIFEEQGITVLADEVIESTAKDVRTEMLKIKTAEPDAVILIPQTIPMANIFAKQWIESGIEAQGYGNDVQGLPEVIQANADAMENFLVPRVAFNKDDSDYQQLSTATECDLDFYCVSSYDGIFILARAIESCSGTEDTSCIRDALYNTKGYEGVIGTTYTFDENGDIVGKFEILQVIDGQLVVV